MLDGAFNNDLWRNSGNAAPNPDANFHSSLWEFLRNNELNARNFFQPTVAPLRQNQFGAALGDPIIHNRTFFFSSYQGLRIRSSKFINNATSPSAAERAGIFSAARANQRPVDPLTKQPFPNATIVSITRGPHAIKTGAQVIYHRYTETGNWLGSGQVRFNGSFTTNTLADYRDHCLL